MQRTVRPLGLIAAVAATLSSGAHAQQLGFDDGVLGSAITYNLTGTAGAFYYLLPSLNEGPTPLVLIDPLDPRVLSIGIDQLNLASLGVMPGTVSYPLPDEAAFQGIPVFAQYITITFLTPTLADQVSNQAAFVMAQTCTSHLTLGDNFEARQGHTLTSLPDGSAVILGGDDPAGPMGLTTLDTAERYDRATQSWIHLGSILTAERSTHTATALADGRVLAVGGYDITGVVNGTAEIYDPTTDSSAAVASMSFARTQHTATRLNDGRVLVTGGGSNFDLSDPLGSLGSATATTEIYDPVNDTWSLGPGLAKPTIGHTATLLDDGRVMIVGGVEVDIIFGLPLPSFSNRVQIYNPVTNSFSSGASLPGGRAYHGSVKLADGTVLTCGGADGDFVLLTFNPKSDAYRYNPGTNTWSNTAGMLSARAYPNFVSLGDRHYIIGGLQTVDVTTGSGTPNQGVDYYDGSTGTWNACATTQGAREVGRAAAVDGGVRILFAGTAVVPLGQPVDRTAELILPE
jgi:N-acetylneuraminic acid mutarotase